MILFPHFGLWRLVNLTLLIAANLTLRGVPRLGNGLRGGGGQIVLTNKNILNYTHPKTRKPNVVSTKGATKVVRHELLR